MRALPWIVLVLIVLVSLGLIFSIAQWKIPFITDPTPPAGGNEKEWVNFQSQTCHELPWRKAWSDENQKPYAAFPLELELTILKSYYAQKGIAILDSKILYDSNPTNPALPNSCTGCGCDEAFSFEVYVTRNDAAVLAISGFKLSKQGILHEALGR